jgi:hydroxypyruvate isomerase
MLALASKYGMQLDCVPIHILVKISEQRLQSVDFRSPFRSPFWSGDALLMGLQVPAVVAHLAHTRKPKEYLQRQRLQYIVILHHGVASVLVC